MKRYMILDVWGSLQGDYVVSDVWKSSYVNKRIHDIIYGRTKRFGVSNVWNSSYIAMCDLRCVDDFMQIDTWYQMDGKAFS